MPAAVKINLRPRQKLILTAAGIVNDDWKNRQSGPPSDHRIVLEHPGCVLPLPLPLDLEMQQHDLGGGAAFGVDLGEDVRLASCAGGKVGEDLLVTESNRPAPVYALGDSGKEDLQEVEQKLLQDLFEELIGCGHAAAGLS
jgi:hypothetical protein